MESSTTKKTSTSGQQLSTIEALKKRSAASNKEEVLKQLNDATESTGKQMQEIMAPGSTKKNTNGVNSRPPLQRSSTSSALNSGKIDTSNPRSATTNKLEDKETKFSEQQKPETKAKHKKSLSRSNDRGASNVILESERSKNEFLQSDIEKKDQEIERLKNLLNESKKRVYTSEELENQVKLASEKAYRDANDNNSTQMEDIRITLEKKYNLAAKESLDMSRLMVKIIGPDKEALQAKDPNWEENVELMNHYSKSWLKEVEGKSHGSYRSLVNRTTKLNNYLKEQEGEIKKIINEKDGEIFTLNEKLEEKLIQVEQERQTFNEKELTLTKERDLAKFERQSIEKKLEDLTKKFEKNRENLSEAISEIEKKMQNVNFDEEEFFFSSENEEDSESDESEDENELPVQEVISS